MQHRLAKQFPAGAAHGATARGGAVVVLLLRACVELLVLLLSVKALQLQVCLHRSSSSFGFSPGLHCLRHSAYEASFSKHWKPAVTQHLEAEQFPKLCTHGNPTSSNASARSS
eukprot:1512253-Amphidinium_carterae.1